MSDDGERPELELVHDADRPKLVDWLQALRDRYAPGGTMSDDAIVRLSEKLRASTLASNRRRLELGAWISEQMDKTPNTFDKRRLLDDYAKQLKVRKDMLAASWCAADLMALVAKHGGARERAGVEQLLDQEELEEIMPWLLLSALVVAQDHAVDPIIETEVALGYGRKSSLEAVDIVADQVRKLLRLGIDFHFDDIEEGPDDGS